MKWFVSGGNANGHCEVFKDGELIFNMSVPGMICRMVPTEERMRKTLECMVKMALMNISVD